MSPGRRFLIAIAGIVLLTAGGTVGYMAIEHMSAARRALHDRHHHLHRWLRRGEAARRGRTNLHDGIDRDRRRHRVLSLRRHHPVRGRRPVARDGREGRDEAQDRTARGPRRDLRIRQDGPGGGRGSDAQRWRGGGDRARPGARSRVGRLRPALRDRIGAGGSRAGGGGPATGASQSWWSPPPTPTTSLSRSRRAR